MTEKVLIGTIELAEAKRLRGILAERGVEVDLVSDPSTCSSGKCGTTVEVWITESDVANFKALLAEERAELLNGLDVDQSRLNAVFDDQNAEATCPACGHVFATTHVECPECGLGFAVSE